jgi:hypothetical protein
MKKDVAERTVERSSFSLDTYVLRKPQRTKRGEIKNCPVKFSTRVYKKNLGTVDTGSVLYGEPRKTHVLLPRALATVHSLYHFSQQALHPHFGCLLAWYREAFEHLLRRMAQLSMRISAILSSTDPVAYAHRE